MKGIPSDSIAIAFEPTNTSPNNIGELTWGSVACIYLRAVFYNRAKGGIDSSKFTGSISYS